jgi:hypothetical protein
MIIKAKLLSISALIISTSLFAQINFQENIITTNADYAINSKIADIDGDGDLDIITAAYFANEIHWYENTNGQGDFSNLHIIGNIPSPTSVFLSDIDGDGDMDVLSTSFSDLVVWYENLDGLGNFGLSQTIVQYPSNIHNPQIVFSADLDGDGDMDVLTASYNDDKIAWYENTDGAGSFGSQEILSSNADWATDVYAIDLDGDGDMDVLSASRLDNKIAWYKNMDGNGNFSTEIIISQTATGAYSVYSTDVDGDGDFDVLASASTDNEIVWYENLDGLGDFGSKNIISSNANTAFHVNGADIDNDGDMDILSASGGDNKIAWYENLDGQGNFGSQQIITDNADHVGSVETADFNGDGLIDILSTSGNDDKVAWYEQTNELSISENSINSFSIYPNPTHDLLNFETKHEFFTINIYNNFGQIINSIQNEKSMDVSNLSQGVYYCKIENENGSFEILKFIKQ